jgi:serine/threonine-protein kinase
MNEPKGNVIFEFGDFRIDLRRRQLYKDQSAVQLTAKSFDTLAALLAANGETVSKAKLMDTVWPETAVEENNLNQQISALRKVFGERAVDHKFIVTVPGRGYCFVAEVRTIEPDANEFIYPKQATLGSRKSFAASTLATSGWSGYAVAAIYILIVCIPAFVVSWRAEMRGMKPQSIAIMQFRSAGVGDDLLGMGIRDTLRAKLGGLDDVTLRPTEPAAAEDVVDAGRQLNVDVVVTGSIQHDEDKIRVAVEMVDVSNERIMWGSTFDDTFSNAFELQDSITTAVLSALKRPRNSGALHITNPTSKRSADREFAAVHSERPPSRRNNHAYAFC